jgi:putative transcriptional regulator
VGIMAVKIKLKNLLIERNLTQKELAEMTGLREATISAICRNNLDKINLKHLKLIMTALNISEFDKMFEL